MAYTETQSWRNSLSSFSSADEAIADMRSHLESSYSDQAKPAAENVTLIALLKLYHLVELGILRN